MIEFVQDTPQCKVSTFRTSNGSDEIFITIASTEQSTLEDALDESIRLYNSACIKAGLSSDTIIFSRMYLSDIENQKSRLQESSLWNTLKTGAVSVIQQPPLFCGPLCLFSYHIKIDSGLQRETIGIHADPWRNGIYIRGHNYPMLWTANYCDNSEFNSEKQTETVFSDTVNDITPQDMSLLGNTVRTWVFVRDVDNFYRGMVKRRRSYFANNGLTEKTHYPASTGIEGRSLSTDSIVHLDSLSIGNLDSTQLVRMEALDHLSPTIEYGVTFERGLRVRFGERSHLYISGTASIDHKGNVLHIGDVRKQTERTIENVIALLENQNATLDDMAYIFVYLRDPNDRDAVRDIISHHFSKSIPCIYAVAAVCRPAWLVEIEGVALIEDNTGFADFL